VSVNTSKAQRQTTKHVGQTGKQAQNFMGKTKTKKEIFFVCIRVPIRDTRKRGLGGGGKTKKWLSEGGDQK